MSGLLQLNSTKFLLTCCIFLTIYNNNKQSTHASSIPIWEALKRSEKITSLYNQFDHMVNICCGTAEKTHGTPAAGQCKNDLLSYGYKQLQALSDTQLNVLDPYQRGAGQLIWTALTQGLASTTHNIQMDFANIDKTVLSESSGVWVKRDGSPVEQH